ncbi:TPA: site-specific integrase [Vibrio vulnificus]|nr:site-specific integrase [Vibrio vulnificus]
MMDLVNTPLPIASYPLPVYQVDFAHQQALRLALHRDHPDLDLPKYLLAPEICQLADLATLNEHQRVLLLMLFNTGARINELLAVTPNDVFPVGERTVVKLKTLKQQNRATYGRPPKGYTRLVPLYDQQFSVQLKRYIVTHCRNQKCPIFSISDETARNWLKAIQQEGTANGIDLLIPLTPSTLRHSFAVHLLLNRMHIKELQSLMGHARLSSTEVYTRLLSFDPAQTQREVRFLV